MHASCIQPEAVVVCTVQITGWEMGIGESGNPGPESILIDDQCGVVLSMCTTKLNASRAINPQFPGHAPRTEETREE